MSDATASGATGESRAGSPKADAFIGIPYGRLEQLLAPVAAASALRRDPAGRDGDGNESLHWLATTFARGALTTIIEPGDTDAHHLLEALGPADTLRAIAEGWEARRIMDYVAGTWPGESSGPLGARSEPTRPLDAGGGSWSSESRGPARDASGGRSEATQQLSGGGGLWSSGSGTPSGNASGGRPGATQRADGEGAAWSSGSRAPARNAPGDRSGATQGADAEGGLWSSGAGTPARDASGTPSDATQALSGEGGLWSSGWGSPARNPSALGDQESEPAQRTKESADRRRALRRLDEALVRWRGRLSQAAAIRAFESAAHVRASFVTPESAHWPAGLAALDAGEPFALWVRGDVERLASLGRSIALVGARAATGYGEHVAMESAAGLGARGFAIVSGGAYGIDGAAHRAALGGGHPTIAFLAGGVDRLYPAGHSDLLRRVADTGALIGELPCGSTPTRWRFLMRNRLIAAVSNATVVVEAGHRSGSLNTAGHASQMGRPLGAVPGPVTSPASAGCHRLIREYAATCVTTVDEMAELAGPLTADPSPGSPTGDSAQAPADLAGTVDDRVLAALHRTAGTRTDEVAARTGLSSREVHAALGRLEATGRVTEMQDGWLARGRR